MATRILDIPEELAGREELSERAIRVEMACRLFDAEVISKGAACRLAGLSRDEFASELIARNLPVLRYTEEMFDEDLKTLKILRELDSSAGHPS